MKFLKAFLFLLSFVAVERFCHHQTEGFRLNKIASELPYREEWATASASEEVQALLSQPYHFLGSGGQCYAFVSQDGKAVIKFFKHHHMRPLPFSISRKMREERLESIFGSFKIAHDLLKDETGLLFLHLNQGKEFQEKFTLIDPIGIRHEIDLNKTTFALQKRAELALPTLQKLMKEGKVEEAKAHLASLLDMIMQRARSGVSDFDPIIKRNMGFVEGKAVEIDLGSFSIDPTLANPLAQKRVLFFETLKLRRWIKKRAPTLLSFFDLQLAKRFDMLSPSLEVSHGRE